MNFIFLYFVLIVASHVQLFQVTQIVSCAVANSANSILAMKQLALFASLGGIENWCSFWLLGEDIMLELYNDIDLCDLSILRLFKFFLLAEVWTTTPKFCNCQTHECCQCIIANILKCSLSYIFISTPFFVVANSASIPSSSKCTKIGIFRKRWFSRKSLKLLHQMSYFKAKNAPNSILAGASPQTPLGVLQRSPRPPSWI